MQTDEKFKLHIYLSGQIYRQYLFPSNEKSHY